MLCFLCFFKIYTISRYFIIKQNIISRATNNDNNIAIAVKDGSKAFVGQNQFGHNKIDISMYIKKKIYTKPILYTILRNKSLNLKIDSGDIVYPKNLQNSFQIIK